MRFFLLRRSPKAREEFHPEQFVCQITDVSLRQQLETWMGIATNGQTTPFRQDRILALDIPDGQSLVSNTRPKTCVYCGIRAAEKDEHVIGKVFFDTLPVDMITVPACHDCDSGKGDGGTTNLHHDEEYMRNVLCMREGAEQHPVVKNLINGPVIRSFANSIPLAKSLLNKTKLVDVRTPDGIWLPYQRHAYHVDLHRIRRVCRKVTRGLHFARERKPLAYDAHITVMPGLTDQDFKMYLSMFAEPWYGLGDHVFMYKAARFPDRPEHGLWIMVFYKCFAVLTATSDPADRVQP